jgi:hypothetical protein
LQIRNTHIPPHARWEAHSGIPGTGGWRKSLFRSAGKRRQQHGLFRKGESIEVEFLRTLHQTVQISGFALLAHKQFQYSPSHLLKQHTRQGENTMQDFINPKSMMTPGIAGATMMFIVNGIVFAFPELQPRIIALILSFLIGSIVFVSKTNLSAAVWTKLVYWVINSLIIFVVGFGSANLAASGTEQAPPTLGNGSSFPSLISSAYAEGNNNGSSATSRNSAIPAKLNKAELTEQLELERNKNAKLSEQLSKLQAEENEKAMKESASDRNKQQEPGFFSRW